MRGNRLRLRYVNILARSIPAYAGEPAPASAHPPSGRVYPRVCGGTGAIPPAAPICKGLSPRMRGNLIVLAADDGFAGSIPAYAGEPGRCGVRASPAGVYPRVCGGTSARSVSCSARPGLSPRMRGNRSPCRLGWRWLGSIPAYAGEPTVSALPTGSTAVYPRVCGGTPALKFCVPPMNGLSPRMRGNPSVTLAIALAYRSIPAYAGEPPHQRAAQGPNPVYPRVCGGTPPVQHSWHPCPGLSPRMRGNQVLHVMASLRMRSIPAYAGEPGRPGRRVASIWVYPRVCGGTLGGMVGRHPVHGLSPRMRGNLNAYRDLALTLRSIPAYAGEPSLLAGNARLHMVYPRVCGGTFRRPRPVR